MGHNFDPFGLSTLPSRLSTLRSLLRMGYAVRTPWRCDLDYLRSQYPGSRPTAGVRDALRPHDDAPSQDYAHRYDQAHREEPLSAKPARRRNRIPKRCGFFIEN